MSGHPRQPDYRVLSGLGGSRSRVQFNGRYAGRDVRWNACIMTLAAYRDSRDPGAARQMIEIGDESTDGIELTVVLDVPVIDAPTVRKTVVMIRNYKRLRPGRHEFGPVRTN